MDAIMLLVSHQCFSFWKIYIQCFAIMILYLRDNVQQNKFTLISYVWFTAQNFNKRCLILVSDLLYSKSGRREWKKTVKFRIIWTDWGKIFLFPFSKWILLHLFKFNKPDSAKRVQTAAPKVNCCSTWLPNGTSWLGNRFACPSWPTLSVLYDSKWQQLSVNRVLEITAKSNAYYVRITD